MIITLDELSVWELGHRLAGANPYRPSFLPLSWRTKDAFRNLVTEIYHDHLNSSILYERKPKDSDLPNDFYIRHHLDDIWAIQGNRQYSRQFLKFVSVEQSDYLFWCEQTGHPIPEFWQPLNVENIFWDYLEDDDLLEPISGNLSKSQQTKKIKQQVVQLALAAWNDNDQLNMTDVINLPQIRAIAKHYAVDTARRWIRPYAPDHIKNKRGRPKSNKNSSL